MRARDERKDRARRRERAQISASPNIDDRGVVQRLRRSLYAFGAALFIVAILQWTGAALPFYLLPALPFFGAFNLAFQGLYKT
ncbi:MAG: hypothetical protein IPG04_14960 [Polyangiaceae bacterium]|nr:hypothetical protein [Polyangiaceae bacterium]